MGKFKVGDYVNGAVVIEVEPNDYDGILNTRIRFGDGRDVWVNSENYQLVHFDQPIVSSFVINSQEYTKEQYEKDCKRFLEAFPEKELFDLSYAMENILIVYQWAQQNPIVTNLDHYAAELGWTEEQKAYNSEICPLPFGWKGYTYCPKESSGELVSCKKCHEWWKQEWKGGKA